MERKSLNSFQKIESLLKQLQRYAPLCAALFRLFILLQVYIICDQSGDRIMALFLFLVLLVAADIVTRFVIRRRFYTGILILLEVLCLMICAYSVPELQPVEPVFLILSLFETCFFFGCITSIIVNLLGGALFCLLSDAFMDYMGAPYPLTYGARLPLFVMPVMVSAVLFCILAVSISSQNALFAARDREEKMYRNLDAINRSISEEMFSIKAASEKKAKKEVTKYIHDNVGYVLTNLMMMLQAANAVNRTDREQGQMLYDKCTEYSSVGLNEIRSFLHNIERDTSKQMDVRKEILYLGKLFEKCTGTEVRIEYGDWPSGFTQKINSFFLSCVKECLTNAVKHGMAKNVLINCVVISKYRVGMTITSFGSVPEGEIRYGIGLKSISESAEELGGKMKVSTTENAFIVHVSLPYVTIQGNRQ